MYSLIDEYIYGTYIGYIVRKKFKHLGRNGEKAVTTHLDNNSNIELCVFLTDMHKQTVIDFHEQWIPIYSQTYQVLSALEEFLFCLLWVTFSVSLRRAKRPRTKCVPESMQRFQWPWTLFRSDICLSAVFAIVKYGTLNGGRHVEIVDEQIIINIKCNERICESKFIFT